MVYYKHILFKVYFYLFIIMYSLFVLFLTRNLNCASVQIVDDVGTVSIKLNYTLKSLAIIFPPSIIRLIISLVSFTIVTSRTQHGHYLLVSPSNESILDVISFLRLVVHLPLTTKV